MSSYIHVFIRTGDNFTVLNEFSRNSEMYRLLSPMPFEKIKPISDENLTEFYNKISGLIEISKETIQKYTDKIKQIGNFENNSVEDKLAAIEQYEDNIEEEKQLLDELEFDRAFIEVLRQIIDVNRFDKSVDTEKLIYMGEEIGHPTINDIEK